LYWCSRGGQVGQSAACPTISPLERMPPHSSDHQPIMDKIHWHLRQKATASFQGALSDITGARNTYRYLNTAKGPKSGQFARFSENPETQQAPYGLQL
jgi:hypothetical protein